MMACAHFVQRCRTCLSHRRCAEHGFVAGAEALIFGVLLFVVGSLVFVNAWRVIDARFAVASAARAATHGAVTAPLGSDPHVLALDAGLAAYAGSGHDRDGLELTAETSVVLERCREIRYRASAEIAPIGVPTLRWVAPVRVTASHAQLVDPHRAGLPIGMHCPW